MKKIFALLLAALLFVSARAEAAAEKYSFDPAHTQIFFKINHMGFSYSHGRFVKFAGGFEFDPATVETSKVDVTIDTDSLDMASAAWETHLKSPDFFDVKQFPAMTFKSTKIEKTGEKTGKLTGDLTLHGVTKPVTLDVTYNGSGVHPMTKNQIAGFSATGVLKRSDFGMNFGAGMIGDDVTLDIQVEGIRQDFKAVEEKK